MTRCALRFLALGGALLLPTLGCSAEITADATEPSGEQEAAQSLGTSYLVSGVCQTGEWSGECRAPVRRRADAKVNVRRPSSGALAAFATRFGQASRRLQESPCTSANDAITTPGQSVQVRGQLGFGIANKALEDESVSLLLRAPNCGPWVEVARTLSDDEGRVSFTVDGSRLKAKGRYDFRMVSVGDMSRAVGSVWVADANTPVVAFDIDGTLTTSDAQIFEEVLLGTEPAMYPDANRVASKYASLGYLPVYITGRPSALADATRYWLGKKGFPVGPVALTESESQVLPDNGHVGAFKLSYLKSHQSHFSVKYAHGNATTDIYAYARAGMGTPKDVHYRDPRRRGLRELRGDASREELRVVLSKWARCPRPADQACGPARLGQYSNAPTSRARPLGHTEPSKSSVTASLPNQLPGRWRGFPRPSENPPYPPKQTTSWGMSDFSKSVTSFEVSPSRSRTCPLTRLFQMNSPSGPERLPSEFL